MFRRQLIFCALALACQASVALADPPGSVSTEPSYAPPPAWVKPVAIPTSGAAVDGAPTQVLLEDYQTKLGQDQDLAYVERVTKILAPEGLAAAGAVSETWDPATQDLTIHHLHVIHGDQVIDALAGGQKMLVLRRENKLELAMLDGRLTATFEPEGLQVGDIIDFAYTLSHHDPALKGVSEDFNYLDFTGVAREIHWREFWPAAKPVRWRLTEGAPQPQVTKSADGTELVFDMHDAEAPKLPAGAPSRFGEMGAVEFTQYADWGAVSALVAPLYAKAATIVTGSPLRAEVDKIAAASTDPKTRATAALKLVEDQTRYVFLGMNDGGLVPADAEVTWSRRFGDCKGKTALLVAVLRTLGIEAEPVLVSTASGDGLEERLPMGGWFDHVMVRAEIGGKVYWLDGTRIGDRDLDVLTVPPYRWALPVRATGAALIKLEPAPLAEPGTTMSFAIDASKGPDAPAPTHVELLYRGEDAAGFRQALASVPRADYERGMRDFFTKADPWFNLDSLTIADDPATGLPRISADGEGRLEWVAAPDGSRFYRVPHSAMGADISFKRQPGPHADAPYAVQYPFYSLQSWKIVLPKDGSFLLIGTDVDQTIGGQHLQRTARIDDGVFTVAMSIRTTETEFPYSEADADALALRDLSRNSVAVAYRVGPGPAAAAQGPDADRAAAQAGSPAAEFLLGKAYANGAGVPLDAAQAMSWFRKAANQGYAPAESSLGISLLTGNGVAEDDAQGLALLQKSVDQNDPIGEAGLAYAYLIGKAVKQDYGQALALYRRAAEQGNADGELGLAQMFLTGQAGAQDAIQGVSWLRKAADKGLSRAEGQLGALYMNGVGVPKDGAQAVLWETKAATQDDTVAMRLLAACYQSGFGVARDMGQAMTWLRRAADMGDPEAQIGVGYMFHNGWGVAQDDAQALQWYEKAAEQGSVAGENDVAMAYRDGVGAPRDYDKARSWLEKAAGQGDPRAENSLGVMYENGVGVPVDMARARGYYNQAAAKNYGNAEYNLGLIYCGGAGVPRDYSQAISWFMRAANHNFVAADTKLGEMYADGVGVNQDEAVAAGWFQKAAAKDEPRAERRLGLAYLSGSGVPRDRALAIQWLEKAAAHGDEVSRVQAQALREEQPAAAKPQ
jgi:TPR repeat protein/transglutaminase-like putative cysteine protease